MSRALRGTFPRAGHRWLVFCACVAGFAIAVLAVDAWVPGRNVNMTEPAADDPGHRDDNIERVAAELGLQLVHSPADASMLASTLAAFPDLELANVLIGPVLSRADSQHRLWLFEFEVEDTLLVAPGPSAVRRPHTGTLTRLGLVIRHKDARHVGWTQDAAGTAPADWRPEARERLARIADLRVAFGGEYVVAVARPGAFGLLEKVQRERSAEFHPGLANSALSIDVQRVIDVVNLLDSAPAPIPPLHRVDVEVRLPDVRKPQIAERMEAVRVRHEQEMDAIRRKMAEQWGTRLDSTTEVASDGSSSGPQDARLPKED